MAAHPQADSSHHARPAAGTAARSRSGAGCLVATAIGMVLALALVAGGVVWLRTQEYIAPTPFEPRCRFATTKDAVVLAPQQAAYATIIVGQSVERGLPARAASIAMATAYQESGIRNLDYGDRDSVGLFQQRPSQGWGTTEQIMDPYYATNQFYDGLVEVDGWATGDINNVAQEVQRSGHPEAYRKHEPNARIIASVLAGHSPAGVTCYLGEDRGTADPEGLQESIDAALGIPVESVAADGRRELRYTNSAASSLVWAVAHHAVVMSAEYGVAGVRVGERVWHPGDRTLPEWEGADTGIDEDAVVITFVEQ